MTYGMTAQERTRGHKTRKEREKCRARTKQKITGEKKNGIKTQARYQPEEAWPKTGKNRGVGKRKDRTMGESGKETDDRDEAKRRARRGGDTGKSRVKYHIVWECGKTARRGNGEQRHEKG